MSCVNPISADCGVTPGCPSKDGCIPGVCPDFQIKRNDTRPPFKVSVEDADGPLDLTGLILEANMWANAKLKKNITADSTSLAFADDIGFEQILPDDIIVMDRVRSPERMRVLGFNECEGLVDVERGYDGTTAQNWKRGTKIKIFRFMNSPGTTEMIYEDVVQVDGTKLCNQLAESLLVYDWTANDTCSPGCFSFEFKLLSVTTPSEIPSVIPVCYSGLGVDWVRRFPACGEFVIKVCDSPTGEGGNLVPSVC